MPGCTELCLWLAGYETYTVPADATVTPPPSPISHLQQHHDTVKESRDLRAKELEETRAAIELLEKNLAGCKSSIQEELLHRQLHVQRSRLTGHTQRLKNEDASLALISAFIHSTEMGDDLVEHGFDNDFDLDGAVQNLEREQLRRDRELRYNSDL